MSSSKEASVRAKSTEVLSNIYFTCNQDTTGSTDQNLPPDYSYLKEESCLRHVILLANEHYDVIVPAIARLTFNEKLSFPPLDWGPILKPSLEDDNSQKIVISLANENKTCASLLPEVVTSSSRCEKRFNRVMRFLHTFNKHSSPELVVEILTMADENIKKEANEGLVRSVLFGCTQVLESSDTLLPAVSEKILATLKLLCGSIRATESTEIWTSLVECGVKVTTKNITEAFDVGGDKLKKLRLSTIISSTSTERVFAMTCSVLQESPSVCEGLYSTLEWYLGSVLGEKGHVEWLQRLMGCDVACVVHLFAVSVQIVASCCEKNETFDGYSNNFFNIWP